MLFLPSLLVKAFYTKEGDTNNTTIYKFKIWPKKNSYRGHEKIVDADFSYHLNYYCKDPHVYLFNVNEILSKQWKKKSILHCLWGFRVF